MASEEIDPCYVRAAQDALANFPVDADDITFIDLSENVTFRVSISDGDTDYVLRLHRPGYNSIEELESERAWTKALSEAGIPVPGALQTRHDENFALVDIPGTGEQRYAGMTTWFEGTALCYLLEAGMGEEERTRIFGRTGEILAAMHNQAARWEAPAGFTRPRLDLDRLLGESPHWGRFWEHAELTGEEKSLLLGVREDLRAALTSYGETPGHFGLIHTDLNPDNLIYDNGELSAIDFDDSAYGWHMYDIAAALIDDRTATDFDAVTAAMLDGYRKRRPLASRDIDMLRTFLLIRGMAIVGWFNDRPEHTGSRFFDEIKDWVLGECRSREW